MEKDSIEKLSVTLDMGQFLKAIDKANELIDTINKAKSLTNDLAYMLEQLNFKPNVNGIQVDEQ